MNILALDTSTEYLSLALLLADRTYTHDSHAGQSHSQQILPVLRSLLNQANIEIQQLDAIAFGAGPGSFTGLRIACGVAQGLAFGANLPVIGISTLMALAQNRLNNDPSAQHVIACLDARMGEVYHAAYERQNGLNQDGLKDDGNKGTNGWREVSAPGLYKPLDVPVLQGTGWSAAGTAWRVYAEELQAIYGANLRDMSLSDERSDVKTTVKATVEITTQTKAQGYDYPTALSIAQLARPMLAAGLGRPAAEAAPVYIRNKVALKTSERTALR